MANWLFYCHIAINLSLSFISISMAMRDAKSRILSNKENVLLLVFGIVLDLVLKTTWMGYAFQLVMALFTFLLLLFPFIVRKVGAGDLKLWVCVTLFLPIDAYFIFIVLLVPSILIFSLYSKIKMGNKKLGKIPFGVPFCIPFLISVWSTLWFF